MPIFKYTVANKEGKKLTGTIESPDQKSARAELNNLGFSILAMKETQEEQPLSESPKFAFEATDKNTKPISGTVPAETEEEAFKKLQDQYNLIVSALWPKNATPEQVEEAKQKGVSHLYTQPQQEIKQPINTPQKTQLEKTQQKEQPQKTDAKQQKKELEARTRIENVLTEVNNLIKSFDDKLNPTQKSEIQKKIDKLLRIKNSKNLEYIFSTAKDLLNYIKAQSENKDWEGNEDEKMKLRIETNKIINSLLKGEKKGFSESVIEKIDEWEESHKERNFINSVMERIKEFFITPEEVRPLKEKIKTQNRQLWEFLRMYFKEPTPEYKEKVKENFKATWKTRKNTKKELKHLQKRIKDQRRAKRVKEELYISFIDELNSFTGWLLAFYIIYYFTALYLNTKDFGLEYVPEGFVVYTSRVFKYVLVILFLLHSATALKVNFFRKTILAEIILVPLFILGSLIAIFNF